MKIILFFIITLSQEKYEYYLMEAIPLNFINDETQKPIESYYSCSNDQQFLVFSSSISKNFSLIPSHHKLIISFQLLTEIYQSVLQVFVDDSPVYEKRFSQLENQNFVCPFDPTKKLIIFISTLFRFLMQNIEFEIAHQSNKVKLKIKQSPKVFSINKIRFFINRCHPSCLTCFGDSFLNCLTCYSFMKLYQNECRCLEPSQYLSLIENQCVNNIDKQYIGKENIWIQEIKQTELFQICITFYKISIIVFDNFNEQDKYVTNNKIFNQFAHVPIEYNQFLTSGQYFIYTNYYILGGYGNWQYDSFILEFTNLQPHYEIYVSMKFYAIDEWKNENFVIQADSNIYSYKFSNEMINDNILGGPKGDQISYIQFNQTHTQNDFTLKLICSLSASPYQASCGISHLLVILKKYQQCYKNCLKCNGILSCQQCQSSILIDDPNSQQCKCSGNSYFNEVTKDCVECLLYCESCTNSNECEICLPKTLRTNAPKCDQCPSGYFIEAPKIECSECNSVCEECIIISINCITCKQGTYRIDPSRCISCEKGYFVKSDQVKCEKCSPNCKSCLQYNYCSICEELYYLQPSSIGCQLSCPDHFFKSQDFRCLPCLQDCSQCPNSVFCSKCNPKFFLQEGKCFTACSEGFFQKNEEECAICSPACLSCENQEIRCTSCRESRFFFSYQCLPSCPSHYFSLNKVCTQCNSNCYDCEHNSTYCISCYEPKILHKSKCIGIDQSTNLVLTKIIYKNNNVSIVVISNKVFPPKIIQELISTTLIYITLNTNEQIAITTANNSNSTFFLIPEMNQTHFSLVIAPKSILYTCKMQIYLNALKPLLNSDEFIVTKEDIQKEAFLKFLLTPVEEENVILKLLFQVYSKTQQVKSQQLMIFSSFGFLCFFISISQPIALLQFLYFIHSKYPYFLQTILASYIFSKQYPAWEQSYESIQTPHYVIFFHDVSSTFQQCKHKLYNYQQFGLLFIITASLQLSAIFFITIVQYIFKRKAKNQIINNSQEHIKIRYFKCLHQSQHIQQTRFFNAQLNRQKSQLKLGFHQNLQKMLLNYLEGQFGFLSFIMLLQIIYPCFQLISGIILALISYPILILYYSFLFCEIKKLRILELQFREYNSLCIQFTNCNQQDLIEELQANWKEYLQSMKKTLNYFLTGKNIKNRLNIYFVILGMLKKTLISMILVSLYSRVKVQLILICIIWGICVILKIISKPFKAKDQLLMLCLQDLLYFAVLILKCLEFQIHEQIQISNGQLDPQFLARWDKTGQATLYIQLSLICLALLLNLYKLTFGLYKYCKQEKKNKQIAQEQFPIIPIFQPNQVDNGKVLEKLWSASFLFYKFEETFNNLSITFSFDQKLGNLYIITNYQENILLNLKIRVNRQLTCKYRVLNINSRKSKDQSAHQRSKKKLKAIKNFYFI